MAFLLFHERLIIFHKCVAARFPWFIPFAGEMATKILFQDFSPNFADPKPCNRIFFNLPAG